MNFSSKGYGPSMSNNVIFPSLWDFGCGKSLYRGEGGVFNNTVGQKPTDLGGNGMEESKERKKMVLEEMLTQYIEMGEEIHKLEMELGRLWKEPLEWREEFVSILRPAGFYVEGVGKLVHPDREVYNITAMRMLPGEESYS